MAVVIEDNFFELFRNEFENQMAQMGYGIEIKDVDNPSGIIKGIILTKEGDPSFISPVVYPDEYYDDYKKGFSVSAIVADVRSQIVLTLNSPELENLKESMKHINAEEAKTHLRSALTNYQWNQRLFKDVPYELVGEFALYAVWLVDGSRGMPVNDLMLADIGISKEEMFFLAKANTAKQYSLVSFADQMFEDMREAGYVPKRDVPPITPISQGQVPLYILTTQDRINGAALIGDDLILQRIYREFKERFYLLPISTHEIYILPSSRNDRSIADLRGLVRTINRRVMGAEDRLSNDVYLYDGKELRIAR